MDPHTQGQRVFDRGAKPPQTVLERWAVTGRKVTSSSRLTRRGLHTSAGLKRKHETLQCLEEDNMEGKVSGTQGVVSCHHEPQWR